MQSKAFTLLLGTISWCHGLVITSIVAPTSLTGISFPIEFVVDYSLQNDLTGYANNLTLAYSLQWSGMPNGLNGTFPILNDDNVTTFKFVVDDPRVKLTSPGYSSLTLTARTSAITSIPDTSSIRIWTIDGIVTLLPLIATVSLAIATGSVLPALFLGIWVCAFFLYGADVSRSFVKALDTLIMNALLDRDHQFIILFAFVMGGFVELLRASGGANGLASSLAKYATTPKRAQYLALLCGLILFFDDYASCLIVGATMLPITDRLKVSRQKLAFLVDSGAAPVAALIPITSWTAFEAGLLQEEINKLLARGLTLPPGYETNGFLALLRVLKYAFYSIFLIFFQFLLIASGREFGPMLYYERMSRDRKVPLSSPTNNGNNNDNNNGEATNIHEEPNKSNHWCNAFLPIFFFVVFVFVGMITVGISNLPPGKEPSIANIFSHVESIEIMYVGSFISSVFAALLYRVQFVEKKRKRGKNISIVDDDETEVRVADVSFIWKMLTCAPCCARKNKAPLLSIHHAIEIWVEGVARMTPTLIILVLAWSLGAAVSDLGAGRYLATVFQNSVDPRMLPSLVFMTCCFIALATGTSYGTMGVMFPIVSPIAHVLAGSNSELYYCSMAAILEGAVFGDHCSFISDTTIMSSMSCQVDLKSHVLTQIPYAFYVASFSLLIGFIPSGMQTLPAFVCYLFSIVLMLVGLVVFAAPVNGTTRLDLFTVFFSFIKTKFCFCCCKTRSIIIISKATEEEEGKNEDVDDDDAEEGRKRVVGERMIEEDEISYVFDDSEDDFILKKKFNRDLRQEQNNAEEESNDLAGKTGDEVVVAQPQQQEKEETKHQEEYVTNEVDDGNNGNEKQSNQVQVV